MEVFETDGPPRAYLKARARLALSEPMPEEIWASLSVQEGGPFRQI